MKNIWNYLVWKYQRSTKGELLYWSGILSWIPAVIGAVSDNQTVFWLFAGYSTSVFIIGWLYWTYVVFLKRDWEEFQQERATLFNKIKTGQR